MMPQDYFYLHLKGKKVFKISKCGSSCSCIAEISSSEFRKWRGAAVCGLISGGPLNGSRWEIRLSTRSCYLLCADFYLCLEITRKSHSNYRSTIDTYGPIYVRKKKLQIMCFFVMAAITSLEKICTLVSFSNFVPWTWDKNGVCRPLWKEKLSKSTRKKNLWNLFVFIEKIRPPAGLLLDRVRSVTSSRDICIIYPGANFPNSVLYNWNVSTFTKLHSSA